MISLTKCGTSIQEYSKSHVHSYTYIIILYISTVHHYTIVHYQLLLNYTTDCTLHKRAVALELAEKFQVLIIQQKAHSSPSLNNHQPADPSYRSGGQNSPLNSRNRDHRFIPGHRRRRPLRVLHSPPVGNFNFGPSWRAPPNRRARERERKRVHKLEPGRALPLPRARGKFCSLIYAGYARGSSTKKKKKKKKKKERERERTLFLVLSLIDLPLRSSRGG